MSMIGKLLLVCALTLGAGCAKRSPTTTAPTSSTAPATHEAAPFALELPDAPLRPLPPDGRHTYLARVGPDAQDVQRLVVPARSDVDVALNHEAGALGRVTIRLVDTGEDPGGGPAVAPRPLGDDALTCAATGCTFTTHLRAGRDLTPTDRPHVLLVQIGASAETELRVKVTSRSSAAP